MSKTIRKIISTAKAAAPISAYSQAIRVDNTVYASGAIGSDKDTKRLVTGGTVAEARQALTNLQFVLEEAGSSLCKVVKMTVLLADINELPLVNEVYKEFFKEPYPARVSYQVVKLPLGAKVEMDAIAVAGEVETVTKNYSIK